MTKKILFFQLFLLIFSFQFILSGDTAAQNRAARPFEQRFVINDLRKIHSAQYTYLLSYGNGTFGSLQQLLSANLIDEALASGQKYGYVWTITTTPAMYPQRVKYFATATPLSYPKSGRLSFYIDETGDMRAADKGGLDAMPADPIIDDCALFGMLDNERCVRGDLRKLNFAQMTFQSSVGNGHFGTFLQLAQDGLINNTLATGRAHGYCFEMNLMNFETPRRFKIHANPCSYGVTGVRSFYIDMSGVLRGADKNGGNADENDPPVEY